MKGDQLVIVDGVRTPFARLGTLFAGLSADELGRIAVSNLLARTGIDPETIDEVIFGCVGQPVDAANVARVIALRAGIPESVPAITVSRNCASGFEALTIAYEKMRAGRGDIFIVGGAESMSQYPFIYSRHAVAKFAKLNKAKTVLARLSALGAFRPSDFKPRIGLMLGLTDPVVGMGMGETAELLARENGITREMQDAFALLSHERACAARERLAEEICPVFVSPDFQQVVSEDNGPREGQTLDALNKLRPVFDRKHGTVTAGNASQVTDGAVALLVMSAKRAASLGLTPMGALKEYAYAGCDPRRMGLGPLFAIAEAERRCGLSLGDADLIEINEAFAAQVLAVVKLAQSGTYARDVLRRETALGDIPTERLNVNGGAISLGHPVGATGARLVLSTLLEMKRRSARRALVTLCVGGGQGGALWLESEVTS
ncbi:MAG: acetyl-CoA acetyltransferase family protein [Candidatus Promineifilaceae bacterium]|jgi:acetyl-CoA acetyltransferase family protein